LTFTVVDWIDIFTRQIYRDILIESLLYCQSFKGLEINAFVIMSNHLHLVGRATAEPTLSEIVRDFKKHTAKEVFKALQSKGESRRNWIIELLVLHGQENSRNENFQLWKHGNHPIFLERRDMLMQRIQYTHYNPVNAGIVRCPQDYIYSSATDYNGKPGLLPIEVVPF